MAHSPDDSSIEINFDDLCSYAVDVWVEDPEILTDKARLSRLMRAAAEKGNAKILGEASHVFPNGAVTAILLLSASHLSIHTWPEFKLANIDLLAYGRINGELMMESLESSLSPVRINTSRLLRAVHS
jgi:S-adenosylmethionine decarboxylase